MSIHLPSREPRVTETDVRRIVREIVRSEVDIRIETLENLVEPAPEPVIPGLVRFAVDAFEVGSLVVNAGAAFAIEFVKRSIR
jgi:hypothetical protein